MITKRTFVVTVESKLKPKNPNNMPLDPETFGVQVMTGIIQTTVIAMNRMKKNYKATIEIASEE